jgi:hypothetical protein
MLLGGMGPVGDIKTVPGKLFASVYALYAGIVFIGTAGLLVAPAFTSRPAQDSAGGSQATKEAMKIRM